MIARRLVHARARASASRWRRDRRGEDDRAEPRPAERRVSQSRSSACGTVEQWSCAGVIYRFSLPLPSSPSPSPEPLPLPRVAVLYKGISRARARGAGREGSVSRRVENVTECQCLSRTYARGTGTGCNTRATTRRAFSASVVHASSSGMSAR